MTTDNSNKEALEAQAKAKAEAEAKAKAHSDWRKSHPKLATFEDGILADQKAKVAEFQAAGKTAMKASDLAKAAEAFAGIKAQEGRNVAGEVTALARIELDKVRPKVEALVAAMPAPADNALAVELTELGCGSIVVTLTPSATGWTRTERFPWSDIVGKTSAKGEGKGRGGSDSFHGSGMSAEAIVAKAGMQEELVKAMAVDKASGTNNASYGVKERAYKKLVADGTIKTS